MSNFFSKFKIKKQKTSKEEDKKETRNKLMHEYRGANNPYIQAKYEWDERYGSFILEKIKWQKISYGLMFFIGVLVTGFVILAAQSRITAFFVKTDQLGKPIYIEKIDPSTKINSSVVRYQLSEFITDVRTVTTDGKLKKTWMQRAKDLCSEIAYGTLEEYWKNNPPDIIAENMNISVKIDSVLPISESESWEVDWTETALKNGEKIGSTHWKAIINIQVREVKSDQEFINNPTGLLVRSLSWSQVK